jgi:thiol-disulfide isomerase/thioredoxin
MVVRHRANPPLAAALSWLFLLLCGSFSVVSATKSAEAPSAIHLTAASFDGALARLASGEHALMEFYMPWCPACQNFAPVYERVAGFFNKGINVAAGVVTSFGCHSRFD